MNTITVIGNIGKDPESRVTAKGTPVVTFSVADNKKLPGTSGKSKEDWTSQWWYCTAFKELAEAIARDKQENDAVNHPSHYCRGGIETIAILKAKMPAERFIGFLEGNVIKYLTRAPYKGNEVQDLEKARWYLERLIKEIDETAKPYLEGMQKP